MNIIDTASFLTIAILYNIFIHQIVTSVYKTYSYEEKFDYGIAFIFLAGFVGIIMSKILLKENEEYKTSITSMGLLTGGIMLVITSVLINWENISDDIRLLIVSIIFLGLFYYFYNKKK